MAGVAHYFTGHEETQLLESAIFISLMFTMLSNSLTIQNLNCWHFGDFIDAFLSIFNIDEIHKEIFF